MRMNDVIILRFNFVCLYVSSWFASVVFASSFGWREQDKKRMRRFVEKILQRIATTKEITKSIIICWWCCYEIDNKTFIIQNVIGKMCEKQSTISKNNALQWRRRRRKKIQLWLLFLFFNQSVPTKSNHEIPNHQTTILNDDER